MLSPVSTGFERIEFKLAVVVYRALHGTECTSVLIWPTAVPRRSTVETARPAALFSTSARRHLSLSAIAHLLLLARGSGTVYLLTSDGRFAREENDSIPFRFDSAQPISSHFTAGR